MSGVLVLNATYEPLNVVSWQRAICLVVTDKAEIVEATEDVLRSRYLEIKRPLVIRLRMYVKFPRSWSIALGRQTVLARDRYTCQYCGDTPGKRHLTIDHVVPRAQGGETRWQNVVAACEPCNRIKDDRTPEQAGMPLARKPAVPRYLAVILLADVNRPMEWDKYMFV